MIGMPRPTVLRSAAVVLYASLALLWLAIPHSVTNWSRDYLPAAVQPCAVPAAEAAEAFAKTTRLPLLYEYARGLFQDATKKM